MITEVLLTALLVALLSLYYGRRSKSDNWPPGPTGLPIIGTLPKGRGPNEKFFTGLQEKYGDIFSVRMGSRLVVGLMRYDIIKEAFASQQLQDRPDMYTMRMLTDFTDTGLVFSSGMPWQNGRRFALRHLRDLGMGRSVMEDVIQEEARALVQDFQGKLGEPMEVTHNVNVAVLNVTWKLVAGERFDLTNKDILSLTNKVEENIKMILGPLAMLDWFTWLNYLPQALKDYFFGADVMRNNMKSLLEFLKRVIRQHEETLDRDNIRDYIDHYLVEMEAQKHDPNSTFRQDLLDLTISILDLYSAGSETTSSTLRWLILYMAVYPEVQAKVQDELDRMVPQDRLPSLQDKLPYLEATLAELNRHMALVTFAVPHMASEDTTVAGYTIPKGAILMGYLKGCHHDLKLWDAPEEFKPERFLDKEGNFQSKEGYVPFSTGRRLCLGESLARMELTLIGSAIIKSFVISAPEGETLNTSHDEPDYAESVLNFAKPYRVVMKKRVTS